MRQDEFLCFCGNKFISSPSKVKSGHTSCCGCLGKERFKNRFLKHGLSGSRLYKRWIDIKKRTNNPNHKHYGHYGGRGIKMCDEWINDPKAFIDYCKTLEGCNDKTLSLDRKVNDGNYEPGNIRFTSAKIQALNRRVAKNNTAKKSGVHYNKNSKKWNACIYVDGKCKNLYYGDSKEEAIAARVEFEKVYFKELGV